MSRRRRIQLDYAPPKSLDEIIAYAALCVPEDTLTPVLIENPDPTRPWLKPRTMPMIWLRHVGPLAIVEPHQGPSLRVVLFDTASSQPAIIERHLVYTKNPTMPVRFRDEFDARNRVADVVESGGALPPEWSWDPPAKFGRDDWLPRRLDHGEVRFGVAAVEWQGAVAKWGVERHAYGCVVKRNGRFVKNTDGRWRIFPTMDAAKTFCWEQDRCLAAAR
jgi:hypothetical protein